MENQNNQSTTGITAAHVAADNDLFRQTMIKSPSHRMVFTAGVAGRRDLQEIITAVRGFNSFTEDNDPHGEHDCGAVTINREKFFWKIDYYDSNFDYGADPYEGPVARLLTIMRSDEY